MEPKKYSRFDLKTKRGLFFNIGLTSVLLAVVTAFEWKFPDRTAFAEVGLSNETIDEILDIPPTVHLPPPPPKIRQPQVIEVPDDEEIKDDIEIDLDIEITEDDKIDPIVTLDEPNDETSEEIFAIVEEQAHPQGGWSSFYSFLQKELDYPRQAARLGIEGKVYVQFVVEKDGSLTDVQVLKGIGAGCDEEALRVVKAYPAWNPGKQRGTPVRVRMIQTVIFRLH